MHETTNQPQGGGYIPAREILRRAGYQPKTGRPPRGYTEPIGLTVTPEMRAAMGDDISGYVRAAIALKMASDKLEAGNEQ